MATRRDLLTSVSAIGGLALGALSPGRAGAQGTANWPSPAEARRIAEAGYIFGLPIVMNYGTMYEYAVDRSSAEFKAPFNELKNEARVYTYQDTAVITPNSDTPYSFATRFESQPGTNPEELIAAAHASCFSMALGAQLGGAGLTPTSIETEAAVTLAKVDGGFAINKLCYSDNTSGMQDCTR